MVSSREHFRRLLLRIVEHLLRDRAAFHLVELRSGRVGDALDASESVS